MSGGSAGLAMSARSILHTLSVTLSVTLADADAMTDAELLRRYAESADAVAFELLVRRHAELVLSVCRSVHPADLQTAEDAFQATFLSFARRAGSIRDASAAGWLFRVARNAALRARRRPHAQLPENLSADCSADATETTETARILSEEVDRLVGKFREPVLLCFYQGFSHTQAAERLGWAVGTVASRLARAKDRLRDRLTRRGVTLPAVGAGLLVGGPATASASLIQTAVGVAMGKSTDLIQKLSTEVLRSMLISKLKLATAGVFAAVILLGGVGSAVAWQNQRDDKKVEGKGAKAKPEDEDLKKLQGKWKPTKIVSNDLGEAPQEVLDGMLWAFVGNQLHGKDPGQELKEVGSFKIDSSKSPKEINMTGLDPGKGQEFELLGIYELKDDTLTICLSDKGKRPAEFKAEKGGTTSLIVLKKEESKPDAQQPMSPANPDKTGPVAVELAALDAELKMFQGEWKAVQGEIDGTAIASDHERIKHVGFTVRGHEVRMRNAKLGEEEKDKLMLAFDITTSSKQINLTAVVAPELLMGKFTPGIYEFKDGKLIICITTEQPGMNDKNRPTEFKAGKGKSVALFVLERVEKK
jgi:RNA polymerase sigma factor (sigma-70 family)